MDLELRTVADEIFERTSPYEGEGLRNHCRRIHHFACMLFHREQLSLDPDLVYLAAMLHDLGLVTNRDPGAHYLERSRSLFRRETRDLGLDPVAASIVDECLLYNHRLRPVPGVCPEAEGFRQAVWIEHSHGFRRYGLGWTAVREVFNQFPRDNFDAVLVDFAKRVVGREPLTLVQGVFF